MKKIITLWMEGYSITGSYATASCLGSYQAIDMDDAVKQYLDEHPDSVDLHSVRDGIHSIWGCRIFDNESEARKTFG